MRNHERLYRDVAHLKTRAGGEQPAGETRFELILDGFLRWPVAINRNMQLLAQHRQTLHMIRVLVRDQDSRQHLRRAANSGEALADLPQAKARVNEHASFIGLQVGAIAGRTAAEDGQANRHDLP